MIWKKPSITTRQDWLNKLGKRLVWYFPAPQAREILSDYQEQFDAGHDRGLSEAELIEAIGAPEEVLNQLLAEEPAARTACLRTNAIWGAALALCLLFLWVSLFYWFAPCVSLTAFGGVLFMLLRGPARVELEREFAPDRTVSPVLGCCVPFALVLVFEAAQQILLALAMAERLPAFTGWMPIGELNAWFNLALEAILALLAVWLLVRSITASIRYFPGVVHTVGAIVTLFFTYVYLHTSNPSDPKLIPIDLLLRLFPYFVGLIVARTFQKWVDGRRPLPLLFQASAVTRQDWFHRLGVSLLGRFPAGQVIEILEDYQEQFELGKERGKSEEDLIIDLGRPEAVVRDLLAEDRKARLRRRRIWPWAVMLSASGGLLLGMLCVSVFYIIGWKVFYLHPVKVSLSALALGSAALFVLLQVRSRAAVEARFPARRRPAVWVFLLPLLAFVLTMGFCLYLILLYAHWPVDITFWGVPVAWYLVEIIYFSAFLLLFLLIWTLARCFSGSIQHLPAAIHAAGSLSSILCAGIFFQRVDIRSNLAGKVGEALRLLSPVLLPYLFGIVLALAIYLAGKPRKES